MKKSRRSLVCELAGNVRISAELFRLSFNWAGPEPEPGQFFMIKPETSAVFLPRAVSVEAWDPWIAAGEKNSSKRLHFLIALRGRGTEELSRLHPGDPAELTGPLGNSWRACLLRAKLPLRGRLNLNGEDPAKSIALVGGGAGIAPLSALTVKYPNRFHFYAGFKNFKDRDECLNLIFYAAMSKKLIVASEAPVRNFASVLIHGGKVRRGRIPGFLEPAKYSAVLACGPEPMLSGIAASCRQAGVPCYVSMERRMACGAGACLGCTVETRHGNKRCCADGPVFPAEEIYG